MNRLSEKERKILLNKGIYKIVNLINNKIYIGSSKNLYNRRKTHFSKLRLNYFYNKTLQKDFNEYGENNFKFEILEIINNINNLINREQYWIDFLKPEYNTSKIAGSNKGYKFSKESINSRTIKQSIPVLQYDLNNNFIREWNSAQEISRELKLNQCHIRECCRNIRKTHGGFKWKNK